MKLKQGESGVYFVSYWTPNGTVTRSTKCTDINEARAVVLEAGIERMEHMAKARSLNMDIALSMMGESKKSMVELISLFEVWLESTNLSLSTKGAAMQGVEQFSRHVTASIGELADVTTGHIREFVNATGRGVLSKQNMLVHIKRFWRWAFNEGFVRANLAENVEVDIKSVPHELRLPKRTEPVTEESFRKLMAHCKVGSYARSAIAISWWTGLRRYDVSSLEWSCLGKDSLKLQTSKTGAWITIPYESPELAGVLSDIVMKDERYVFPDQFKRLPLRDRCIETVWKTAGANSTFHGLRSAFASRMAAKGIELPHIRSMMGHASEEMTKRYIHAALAKQIAAQPQASSPSQ